MNATRWIGIAAVAAATAGFTATVIANDTEPNSKSDQSSTDINRNPAAQLDQSATPRRSGDSTAQHGSNNAAAQLGSGLNANAAAQLNNEIQATPSPPVDSDSNTPEAATPKDTDKGTKSHD